MGCSTSSAKAAEEVAQVEDETPPASTSGSRPSPECSSADKPCPDSAAISNLEAGGAALGEPLDPDGIKLAARGEEEALEDAKPPARELDPQERALQKLLAGKPGTEDRDFRPEESMPALANVGTRRPSADGVGLAEYVRLHEKNFSALLELDKNPGWTFKKRELGVDIYTSFDGSKGLVSFKGVADMDCRGGVTDLLENFFHPSIRPQFDELCSYGELVEQCIPYYRVAYFQFMAPPAVRGIVKNRDAVLLCRFRFEPDGSVMMAVSSTVHEKKPEDPNFVRLDFHCGGYIVRPKGQGLQVTFLGTADPQGWIPAFIKNLVAWKQPLVLGKFKASYNV